MSYKSTHNKLILHACLHISDPYGEINKVRGCVAPGKGVYMSVSLSEQETIISYSRDEDFAYIWTSDSTIMTKLDKRVESGDYEIFDIGKDMDGNLLSKEYRCPKNLISFRSKKKELTEEQKQASGERMKEYWDMKRSQKQI